MKHAIRVLIADDDAGMRLVLRKMVAGNDAFQVVAEAEDGEAAVEAARTFRPDVAFLDIDMPRRDGLSCAREICAVNPDAAVIFATAHEGFMSDAFELYAYDYLVKPFKAERVRQTLARLEHTLQRSEPVQKSAAGATLTIRNRDGIRFIKAADILLIERCDRASVIVTADGTFETTESLSELEQRLDPHRFLRSHRSFLINTAFVTQATPYGRWTYALRFAGTDREALITHEKMEDLQKIL